MDGELYCSSVSESGDSGESLYWNVFGNSGESSNTKESGDLRDSRDSMLYSGERGDCVGLLYH